MCARAVIELADTLQIIAASTCGLARDCGTLHLHRFSGACMNTTLEQYLAVGCAGFFGAIARLAVGHFAGRWFTTTFPVGTMVVNLSGSLLLGLLLSSAGSRLGLSETTRMALAVGFVGSYTTFSTFMYESNKLLSDGESIKAAVNLLGSLVLGLVLVRLGLWIGGR
jgi:CrcB protein